MLDSMRYVNTNGEEILIGNISNKNDKIFANYNNIRDYVWSYRQENNKISGFNRKITEKTLPLIIKRNTADRMLPIFEYDINKNMPGKLYISERYLECYIYGVVTSMYLVRSDYIKITLKIVSDTPIWIKEKTVNMVPVISNSGFDLGILQTQILDLGMSTTGGIVSGFDLGTTSSKIIENYSNFPAAVKIVINGPCSAPRIIIGENLYQVATTLSSGEKLIIDGFKKKTSKVLNNGKEENVFSKRNTYSYIYKKIQAGVNLLSWDSQFIGEITVYEEWSVPIWDQQY